MVLVIGIVSWSGRRIKGGGLCYFSLKKGVDLGNDRGETVITKMEG